MNSVLRRKSSLRGGRLPRGWKSVLLALSVGAAVGAWAVTAGVPGLRDVLGSDASVATGPLVIGLVGLASSASGNGDIAQLIEKIERFQAGADDVEFASERDDEVGRLYDAVGSLAASADTHRRDRDDERYREELYRVTSDTDLESEEKIRRLLEIGCERLGVENGLLTRIDEERDRYEVENAAGGGVEEGTASDLAETFRREAIDPGDVLGVDDARAEGVEEDPCFTGPDSNCRIGGTVEVDDDVYGTVCFVDEEQCGDEFTHGEKAFVGLLSRWVSTELERRERTAELRMRERALEAAPVGVTITDPGQEDNPIIYANERFSELAGYPTEEVVGRNCRFLQGERTSEESVGAMRAAIDAGESVTTELRNYRRDGTEFWNRVSIAPVRDEDGDVTNFVGFQEDVTERMERGRRIEAIVENTTNPIHIKDRNGVYQFVNEAACENLGLDIPDVVGNRAEDVFEAENAAQIREVDEQVLATGESITAESRKFVDGEERVFIDNKSPYRDRDGEIIGVVGLSNDITERKERERRLERQSSLLDSLFEQIPINLYVKDEDGRHVRTSTPYLREEYTDEECFRGKTDLDLYDERIASETYADDMQVIESGEPVVEKEEFDPAEAEWLLTSKVPWRDDSGDVRGLIGVSQYITERKERERELRETKQRLELALEGTNTGIWEWDLATDAVTWNETLQGLLGLDADEFAGTFEAFEQRIHPDDVSRVETSLEQVVERDEEYHAEFRLRHEDGDWVWVGVRGRLVYDEDGGRRMLGVVYDITERKEYEQQLQEERDRFATLFESLPNPAFRAVIEGGEPIAMEVNESFEATFGVDRETIRDEPLHDYVDMPPAERARIPELNQAIRDAGTYRTEIKRETVDGLRTFQFDMSLRDLEDETAEGYTLYTDVTERKERKRELQETNERLGAVIEASPAAIVALDLAGNVELWNTAAERILGWEESAVFGEPAPHVPADVAEEFDELIERVRAGETVTGIETRRKTRSGDLIDVSASAAPLRDSDGDVVGAIGILEDISERKAAERRSREREAELERYREFTEDVLDTIDDVFYLLDEEWNLQRWNESLCEMSGYSDEEIAEMDARDFFDAEDAEDVVTALEDIENSLGEPLEVDILTKDGESLPFEFVAASLEDPEGNRVVAGIGRDISERKERERELSRLVSNVPGFVYSVRNEPGWPTEFASDGVRDITGYDADAFERGELTWGDIYAEEPGWIQAEVQAALDEREPFSFAYPIETADGQRRWVKEQGRGVYDDDGSVRVLEGVVIDITERKEYEQSLERTRELLSQAERLADVGGWQIDLQSDEPDLFWTTELYRLHGLSPGTEVDVEEAIDYYHPDDRQQVRQAVDTAIQHGESYDVEARLQPADGGQRWVRSIGQPVEEDGEVVRIRGSMQDVTDQKEREIALRSLHEAARGLLGTETETATAELVVETAASVLDVPYVSVYLLDEETNRLEPAAYTDAFERVSGGAPPVGAHEDAVLWNCFATGNRTVFGNDDAGRSQIFGEDVEAGLLVPVGEHGVFALASDEGTIDDSTRRLVETFVATTEAAFDRLATEAALRERDAELESQNQRLRRQIQITEIIRGIDQSLVGATSRDEIEAAVCERLAEAEDVSLAWIGSVEPGGDELVPRTWAGEGQTYLNTTSLALSDDITEPAVVTATADGATVVPNVGKQLHGDAWRRDALASGYHSVVSVPLTFEEYSYGVLAVYADEPGVFDDLERAVFAELGQSIANAITDVKTRTALHSDALAELTLRMDQEDEVLAQVARQANCTVEYEGLASQSAEETRLFLATTGGDVDEVQAVLDDLVAVQTHRLISEDDHSLFEVTVSGTTLAARLVRHGASPRSITATPSGTEFVVDVPTTTDVREFTDMLRESYPSVELAARRDVERGMGTRQQLVSSLFEDLTERQLEVLRTAYLAGYFEWPRGSTGEDIAEMLGVTQPTVNRHLRLGQQRLLAQLFEEDAPAVTAE